MIHIPSVLKLIVAVFFLATLPEQLYALTPSQIFDKVKDSIVVVKTLDVQGKVKMQGSGVLLPSGKIATNCHVVKEGASYQVGRGKQLVPATLYAEDIDKDICLLDAKGITGKPAQLGKAAGLKVGEPVYAVGAPQGLELSLSDGIVAQLRGEPPPLIQTTAAISQGSSGGGLFDGEGRLVGLTTLYLEAGQSLNFAMPVEWIVEVKPGQKGEWIAVARPDRKSVAEGYTQTEWLKHANDLEQKEEWRDMIALCREWTKSEPKNVVAWYKLGIAYGELKRGNDAMVELGWAYGNLDRYEDAVEAFRQALRIDPKYTDAWYNLGTIYRDLKRYNDAIEAYLQAIRIRQGDAKTWFELGFAYGKLKRSNDQIEAYRQAIRINPNYVHALLDLGLVYRDLERFNDAIETFRQLIRIDSKSISGWYSLGITYGKLNRYNDAIEAYRQAIRIYSENSGAWYNIGFAYSKIKRYEDAIEAFRQALRIAPKYTDAWYSLGEAYGKINRIDDTIEAFRQALSIDPKYADAWYSLGTVYALSGNREAALDTVRELRRLDPERADNLFKLIMTR
jgi:tetratricopeptide (TPR) repeat protein